MTSSTWAIAVWSPAFASLGRTPPSATPYTQSFAVVHRLREGLVVEADYYLDRAAALEAVGLRE